MDRLSRKSAFQRISCGIFLLVRLIAAETADKHSVFSVSFPAAFTALFTDSFSKDFHKFYRLLLTFLRQTLSDITSLTTR